MLPFKKIFALNLILESTKKLVFLMKFHLVPQYRLVLTVDNLSKPFLK